MPTYNVTFSNAIEPKNKVIKNPVTVTTRTVTLVEPCDILNPTIITAGSYINANYVTGLFGRNYYITSQNLTSGKNFVTLKCDALTSFAKSIIGTSQYVVRCESESNDEIIDTAIPLKNEYKTVCTKGGAIPSGTSMFLIGVIN